MMPEDSRIRVHLGMLIGRSLQHPDLPRMIVKGSREPTYAHYRGRRT